MGRYPFGIPNGWFLLTYSEDLAPGAVERFHYVGRELVAYRGASGEAHVFDAHCPHLGAHLGVGGKVVGDTLQCPFHGWRFDPNGRCVDVPYSDRIPNQAKLRNYPSVERNGMLFFWYHAEDHPPFFEIPDAPEWHNPDFTRPWIRHEWTVQTHCQEMQENSVDGEHFANIHRMDVRAQLHHEFHGYELHWSLGARKEISTLEGTEDELRLESESWGLGYNLVRQQGQMQTLVATGLTPIDEETTQMRLGVIAKRDGRSDDEMSEWMERYMAEHAVVATEDFHIWENKLYRQQPLLMQSENGIAEYRNWAKRFYSPTSEG
ncbi:Rieske (2Fe-2S) protein [Myxococcota bacterium]|nr:Rieske (2Fe-2S) protein [Myxococcota bacterium]